MVITQRITLKTKGQCDIIDITPQVAKEVTDSEVNSGTITLFIPGSTAGITIIEFEPRLISDFQAMWDRIIPKDIPYNHDRTWGDGNGYSHIRTSLLGTSLVVPFTNKILTLGAWQQVVLVDFDNRPRSREVVLQIMGE